MPWGGRSEALHAQDTVRRVEGRDAGLVPTVQEKALQSWRAGGVARAASGAEAPPGRDRWPGRVQGWLQGNKGMGLTLSGRPFTLRSHLKTGVVATPGWGETGLYDRQGEEMLVGQHPG